MKTIIYPQRVRTRVKRQPQKHDLQMRRMRKRAESTPVSSQPPKYMLSEGIEHQLLMNRLDYPQGYDGSGFNTDLTSRRRKRIPTYLRNDLPSLHQQKRRQTFKGTLSLCPPPSSTLETLPTIASKRITIPKKPNYATLKDSLRYALIMSDYTNNQLTEVIEEILLKQNKKKKPAKKFREDRECFEGTLGLVLELRKKKFIQQEKRRLQQMDYE